MKSYPSVDDITKQYLYQLAFNDFIDKHQFAFISNAFLMPTEDENSALIGEAKMEIFERLSCANFINISVIKLSASKIFRNYLSEEKFDIFQDFDFLKILKNFKNH